MADKKEKKVEKNLKENVEEVKEVTQEKSEEKPKELSAEERIAILEREKTELHDKWLRSVAEFDNFRKRSAIEKSKWIKNANQRLVLELCDVNDNFERALQASEDVSDKEKYEKGIKLIHQQLSNILKREGVEKIKSEKAEFDPEFHEALAHIPSELAENQIVSTIQNGYIMNGVVIRAARVAVSNGEKPVEQGKPEDKKTRKNKNRRK